MEPLVSILIPAYNAQRWIAESLESALAQTWRRKEIVVVDDGSTDDTVAVAHRYESRHVLVVAQKNQGAAVARNTAYANCQGDYIQWLDADDVLDPKKVELQMRAADYASSRTLISGAWSFFHYRKRKARFTPSPLWADLSPVEWLTRKLETSPHMQTDNWLVSRELSDLAGPWDPRLWRDNDGEYFCRVLLASDGTKFVPEARSYYRAAGFKSISHIGGSSKKLESLFLSMRLHMGYLRSLEDSPRTRAACASYIRTWLHEFYPFRMDIANELKSMASELGGKCEDPRLSWKYDWLVRLFGWDVGRRAQILLPRLRSTCAISWDLLMSRLEASAGISDGRDLLGKSQRG